MIPSMARKTTAEPTCSIARTVQVLGDRWTLLIVREAFRGRTKFNDFQEVLGIPRDVLTARLSDLIEAGIVERRPYKEAGARERFAYHLTPAGDALLPVLGSLIQWGDEYRRTDHGPTRVYRSATTGEPVRVAFVTASGEIVPDADIEIVPGPGERNTELPAVRPLGHA
jgi:DNA-binding HxlR family transcriptional regulator